MLNYPIRIPAEIQHATYIVGYAIARHITERSVEHQQRPKLSQEYVTKNTKNVMQTTRMPEFSYKHGISTRYGL